jgi:hypothetical protein
MHEFQTREEEQTPIEIVSEPAEKNQIDLDTARLMKREWDGFHYAACLHRFQSLGTVENPEALALIYEVLYTSQFTLFAPLRHRSHRRTIAERAAACLSNSPSEAVLPYLIKMLFIKDSQYALIAESALDKFGDAVVPALVQEMDVPVRRPYWNSEGVGRVIALLKRYKDTRTCKTLIKVAQKRIDCGDGRLFKYAPGVGFLLMSLITVPMGFWAVADIFTEKKFSLENFLGVAMYLGIYTLGTLFSSIFCAICLIPVQALYDRSRHSHLARLALQALQIIHHKSMAPQLALLAWNTLGQTNDEALKALRPLLALVTPDDTTLFASTEERLLANALGKHDEDLTLSILRVLECVGTAVSLPNVNRIALFHRDTVLGECAVRTYNAIEERVGRQEEKKSLLRASEMPEHFHELLRPSQDASEQEAQKRELLRPTEGNEE